MMFAYVVLIDVDGVILNIGQIDGINSNVSDELGDVFGWTAGAAGQEDDTCEHDGDEEFYGSIKLAESRILILA